VTSIPVQQHMISNQTGHVFDLKPNRSNLPVQLLRLEFTLVSLSLSLSLSLRFGTSLTYRRRSFFCHCINFFFVCKHAWIAKIEESFMGLRYRSLSGKNHLQISIIPNRLMVNSFHFNPIIDSLINPNYLYTSNFEDFPWLILHPSSYLEGKFSWTPLQSDRNRTFSDFHVISEFRILTQLKKKLKFEIANW
jgi:hypothetical protein